MKTWRAPVVCAVLAAVALFVSLSAVGENEDSQPRQSVMVLMTTVITPATNTMWSIEAPATEAEWQTFAEAADAVIRAGRAVRHGGSGPHDDDWASNADWQAWADTMIAAAEAARTAAESKDVNAYIEATDVMYPPCEECHIAYNPGLQ
ncbi:MAG: hypothetical protein AAGA61_09495 [Pseudomonadota bacterium]